MALLSWHQPYVNLTDRACLCPGTDSVQFGMFFYGNPDYQASEYCGCWVTSLWLATVFGVFMIELLVGGGYAVYTASIQVCGCVCVCVCVCPCVGG